MSKKEQMPNQNPLTFGPFSGSKKVYVSGKIFPIQVPMREIRLSPPHLSNGTIEQNSPVTVYDSSGPYTDENAEIDIHRGLPRIRESWIIDRGDVRELV